MYTFIALGLVGYWISYMHIVTYMYYTRFTEHFINIHVGYIGTYVSLKTVLHVPRVLLFWEDATRPV